MGNLGWMTDWKEPWRPWEKLGTPRSHLKQGLVPGKLSRPEGVADGP